MIASAIKEEEKDKLNIEYLTRDVTSMGILGSFDIVNAVYLLTMQTRKS